MKIEVDVPEWCVQALGSWTIPAEHSGPSIENKIVYLIDDACQYIESAQQKDRQSQLYKTFNLPDPNRLEDDDIPF